MVLYNINVVFYAVAVEYSQRFKNNSMELEENVAYDANGSGEEGGGYEVVPVASQENRLPNIVKDTNNNYYRKPVEKTIITVVSFAFFLAFLALLAAAIAMYLSTSGTEVAKTSSQDNLQSISTVQKMVQILQTKLNDSLNQMSILQNKSNKLQL